MLDVNDVRIFEAANHMKDRVGLPDVREKLIAESLTFTCAADESRDVDDSQIRENGLFALRHVREARETLVDDGNDADVRLDRAERIIRALRACRSQRVENGRLPDVGQPNDSCTQTHELIPASWRRRGT